MSQQMQYQQSEQGSSFNMTSRSTPAGLVPESSDLFSMDGLSRPSDIDSPFGSYSLATLGHAFGDYRTLGNAHANQVLPQDPGRSNALPLLQFIRGDAPWTPLRADATSRTVGSKSRQPNGFSLGGIEYSYTSFRTTAVPSECEDSGYYGSNLGSMRPSVVGASVCGETDGGTETQSFIQPFSDLQLHQSRSPESVSASAKHRQKEQWNRPAGSDATIICPTCNSVVKTKAELNKHKLRHEKPFVCKFRGCTRKQGFGTSNDLDRHMKSVHAALGLKYRCDEGQCKTKLKDWPRADNFKQHLKRIHNINLGPDADLSRYEYKPPRPDDLACLGTSEAQVPTLPDQRSSPSWMSLDPAHDVSGLPSGEISSQQDQVMELPDAHGLVSEQMRSMASQAQHPWDSSRVQMDMNPILSGLGNHQRHISPSVSPDEMYPTQGFKADAVSPADLGSPVNPREIPSGPTETRLGVHRVEDSSLEVSRRDDQPQVSLERTAQGAAEKNSNRAASEAATAEDDIEEDAEEDDAGEDDPGDAFHDAQDLLRTLDPSGTGFIKTSASQEDKPLTSELPPFRDLLDSVKLDETEASALVESLMEKGMLDKIMIKFGYLKAKEEEDKADEGSLSSAAPVGKDGKVMCPEFGCGKNFKRHCELKKHVKRHMKPYACTHTDCAKRFGSKNDWKRHENSQHIQLEFWRCAERIRDGPDRTYACGKICHRKETFKNHLEKDHGITDPKISEKRCTDCRNGRNFESRYWCGFCQRTIEFQKNGGLAWSERFDHIDAHFTGRGGSRKCDIGEWKSIESVSLETFQMILPDTRSAKGTPGRSSPAEVDSASGDGDGDGDANARKRRADNDEEASAKRRKLGGYKNIGESILWVCCACESMYVRAMTTRCVESNCSHDDCCVNCTLMLQEE